MPGRADLLKQMEGKTKEKLGTWRLWGCAVRVACETEPSLDNQGKQEEEVSIQPVPQAALTGNQCLSVRSWRAASKGRGLRLYSMTSTGKESPHLKRETPGH